MKLNKFLATAIVLVVSLFVNNPLSATSQPKQTHVIVPRVTPADIDIVRYPVLDPHEMTTVEMARMGLTPKFLDKPVRVLNYTKSVNGFVYDDLKTGELVVVTPTGELVYKAGCSNRSAEVKPCSPCPPTITAPAPAPLTTSVNKNKDDGFAPAWFRKLILPFLALLVLLALALLASELIRRLRRPAPVPYPVVPVAPIPVPVHPELGKGTRGPNGEIWYGPFETVTISYRHTDGYHVAVDGHHVGIFTTPIRVENAGQHGSWLVIQQ